MAEDQVPLEMQLDLLVDEELSEVRRRELLKSLDRMPAQWRELSIRFLERQVERRTARQMMAAGGEAIKPAEKTHDPEPREPYRFPGAHWLTPRRYTAIAAGLLIAVSSALVTSYVLRRAETQGAGHRPVATLDPGRKVDTVDTSVPGSVFGMDQGEIPVQVSVVPARNDTATPAFFPQNSAQEPGSRRSVIIKPDGTDAALVIPVRGLQFQ